MREIKFRLFGKNSKEFLNDKNNYGLSLEELQNVPDLNVWEISQCTGLKDKNGKEIWRGDIVRLDYPHRKQDTIQEVKWNGYYYDPFFRNDYDGYLSVDSNEVEVIGNIYENPDLLKTLDKK